VNNQEAFDTVVKHLRAQGKRCVGVYYAGQISPTCLYRGADGLKCAAGILISDEEYASWMEGMGIIGILITGKCPNSLRSKLQNVDQTLLMELQDVHDNSPEVEWEEKLHRLATRFDLTIPSQETP
jgi:hypothetical protein